MGRAAAFGCMGGWVGVRCVGQDGRLAAASTPERRIPPFHVQMGMASTGIGKNWYYSSVGFKLANWRPTDTETRDNGAKGRPSKSRIDSYANWSATQHHRRWPASSTPTHRPTEDGARGRAAPPPEGSVVSSCRAKVEVAIISWYLLLLRVCACVVFGCERRVTH